MHGVWGAPKASLGIVTIPDSSTTVRDQLWSPVQNTSVWLAWWVHNVISTDELLDAFRAVQGAVHLFDDATSATPRGLMDVLKRVREVSDRAPVGVEERPLVSLVLAGAGDVPPLPAPSEAARAVNAAGAGIVLADEDPELTHVLVPEVVFSPFHEEEAVLWRWHEATGPVPPLPTFGPGEADEYLRGEMDAAARAIESSVHVRTPHTNARLAVGSLSDAFGLPGLPAGMARRAAQLMARADYAAAIIDLARRSSPGPSLDPYLLPLLRAIRRARMTAVDYAVRELLR